MATIKLQPSGAVVIKDGKVACTCCAQPGCCLYPSPSSGTTLPYPIADLPDSVLIDGLSFSKNNPPLSREIAVFPPVFADVYYGDPLILSFYVALYEEMGVTTWAAFAGGSTNNDACLIGLGFATAKDEFPDTLTVNGTDSIERDPMTNFCTWSGGSWTLRYNSTTYKFQLNGTAKTGDQNEPTGTYGANSVT